MKTRAKQLLISALALGLICFSIAGWTAIKVVAWVRDLPNRIVIDGDALANTFGSVVVQSYHEGLIKGDVETQSQIIRDFTSLVTNDAAAQKWVRTEYSTDIRLLSSSPNSDVATLAAKLLTLLPERDWPSSNRRLPRPQASHPHVDVAELASSDSHKLVHENCGRWRWLLARRLLHRMDLSVLAAGKLIRLSQASLRYASLQRG